MDKITYLAELAEGLARWVPERERQDILRYYAEYFEEAGPGREAEVVAELGDPWALSCRLAVEGGYVTHEQAMAWRPRKRWPRVLIGAAVGLAVFAMVFNIGLLRLIFNTVWTTSYAAFSEVEPVTVVDWGLSTEYWGEYNVALIEDDPSLAGFYYTDGGNLSVFNSIDADISLGNVEVVYADDFTLSMNRSEALSGYDLTWEVTDGVLRLRDGGGSQSTQINSWEDLKNLFGVDWLAVDVIITVPGNAALDRVSVKTGLGNVLLYGVDAETVTAETGMGNVECYEARSVRRLDLSTGMGNVNLVMEEAIGGLNVSLESGMGNVEAMLAGFETDYSYTLESGLGAVTVNGSYQGSEAERRSSAPYRLDAESGTGDVNVYFTFD